MTDDYEVVKWYTRARRFPQLIGKTPDGASIWGGPYTYTQVIGGAIFLVIGAKTTWLWGQFGAVGNVLVLLAAGYGFVLLLGQIPAGARNPLSVTAGVIRAVGSPSSGMLAGSPLRLTRPHTARTRITHTALVSTAPSTCAPSPNTPTDPPPTDPPGPVLTDVQRRLCMSLETM